MGRKSYKKVKRGLDVIFSLVFLVILSPIFLIITLLILFNMGRPIFFSQLRVGQNKKRFKIYKFRSMIRNARALELKGKSFRDVITPLGRIIRPLHLDEFPQLINILKGDMSFVGPRPLAIWDKSRINCLSDNVWSLKPGATDISRSLRYNQKLMDKTIERLFHKNRIKDPLKFNALAEEYYSKNQSGWLDTKIIGWTLLLEIKNFVNLISGKQHRKYKRM